MSWRDRAESADAGTDAGSSWKARAEPVDKAAGEPGHAGTSPYPSGDPDFRVSKEPIIRRGDVGDAVRTWANTAALKAGPQIEGALGAVMQAGVNNNALQNALWKGQAAPTDLPSMADAYRDVRNEGAKQHEASENTLAGHAGSALGVIATPIPFTPAKGATAPQRAWQSAKVGGGMGFAQGAATSKGDLTTMDSEQWKRVLKDALLSGGPGFVGGGVAGAALSKADPALRSVAETQALRAAGLRGGISNQVQKKLGLSTEEEARALGREFLDEGLIPFAGSKESVAKAAEKLQDMSSNSVGAQLAAGEASGVPFDYAKMVAGARDPLKVAPGKSTAVADLASGKAHGLADALEAQGVATPGSWVEANRAKSDAWKSANFADDAPMAAQLYRKSVGGARDSIEEQLAAAVSPEAAAALRNANRRYGVAADALKLARDTGTREQANSVLGLREQLMLAAGLGGGAGSAAGRPVTGLATGIAGALLSNWGRKHGNAALARTADFAAERAAQNTGAAVGSSSANALTGLATSRNERLRPYLEMLGLAGDEDTRR